MTDAVKLFREAATKEASGNISAAIDLYRQAYRINPQVDAAIRADAIKSSPKVKRLDEEKMKQIDVAALIESFKEVEIQGRSKLKRIERVKEGEEKEGEKEGEDIHLEHIQNDDSKYKGIESEKDDSKDNDIEGDKGIENENDDSKDKDIEGDKDIENEKDGLNGSDKNTDPEEQINGSQSSNIESSNLESSNIDSSNIESSEATSDPSSDPFSTPSLPSPLTKLPADLWLDIMRELMRIQPESWFALAMTCKKFAYLGLGTSDVWRSLCYEVYPRQRYTENVLFADSGEEPVPRNPLVALGAYGTWRQMLSQRPYVRFHGCYISTVRYYNEGGKAEFLSSWTNPIRTITYYRYLRFYEDGTVLKVLTELEPALVVPNLQKSRRSLVDDSDAGRHRIYHGTWTMSVDGEVHVEIRNGSVLYYIFHYNLWVSHMGRHRHARLKWGHYYAVRKATRSDDEREGEITQFGIGNEKPFRFARVRRLGW